MKKNRRTQAERHEEAEQKLIQAAIQMVAERGYDQLRLAELGEAAGFSRSLAAHYFGNRDALMRRVVEEILSRTVKNISESENADDDPLEAIFRRIRSSLRRWTREPTDGRAIFSILAAGVTKPELALDVQNHNANVIKWFATQFKKAINDGLVRSSINPEAEARLCLAMIRGVGTTTLIQPDWDAESIIEHFIETSKVRYVTGQ
ncbi:TetR/AcrR family transcriptional regulator [Agrobacterium pusense]|uniref:TetR/AcrR family transcriptional regulator n=1 Tax=Agrobacterium pusense TaxID=648995 RepID=UPI003FD06324